MDFLRRWAFCFFCFLPLRMCSGPHSTRNNNSETSTHACWGALRLQESWRTIINKHQKPMKHLLIVILIMIGGNRTFMLVGHALRKPWRIIIKPHQNPMNIDKGLDHDRKDLDTMIVGVPRLRESRRTRTETKEHNPILKTTIAGGLDHRLRESWRMRFRPRSTPGTSASKAASNSSGGVGATAPTALPPTTTGTLFPATTLPRPRPAAMKAGR